VYQGGQTFGPTLPEGNASPGEVVPVSIHLLPLETFLGNLPSFQLSNPAFLAWVADRVVAQGFSVRDNKISIRFAQDNPFSILGNFTIAGDVRKYPGSSTNYGGAYVEFGLRDYLGRTQVLRLRHNSWDSPDFQLVTRGLPYTVSLISYDDLRLSIVYSKDNKVSTSYLVAPSSRTYALGQIVSYSGEYIESVAHKCSGAYLVEGIQPKRFEETVMLAHADDYFTGRIGAEIAYVIAIERLGLKDVVLQEPSVGGRDLYTKDNTVAIQTTLARHATYIQLQTIQTLLAELVRDVRRDYHYQPRMKIGYAIVSFADTNGFLKSIVLEVPRP